MCELKFTADQLDLLLDLLYEDKKSIDIKLSYQAYRISLKERAENVTQLIEILKSVDA